MNSVELWGGPECTVNRVGDTFRDQFAASGHDRRIADLDLFKSLGLTTIRYPVLWEHVAPDHPDACDWRFADERLGRIRALGLRPIVGLVHHGSGPRYTNLLADDFASGLALHARRTAERFPWVEAWAPVNEPLTTARFSALYGTWYPHHRDERSFWLALLNQIDAVRLSMAEIRRINPAAQLIQTDDLGRTYATAAMKDQAAFDNVRRWMGWDLLCGRVKRGHDLWDRLSRLGFEGRLAAIADAPCPPDIVGVNHYLTSDRFLDHRVRHYPDHVRGSNGHETFADTEAVRVLDPPPPGLRGVLSEAWERYGLPLAVTEVHNGCTREEQMRWMAEAWCIAGDLRRSGVDVRAVTSWALLGSFGWNTLLTEQGCYEPGAFDLVDGEPQPTAMVPLLQALAAGTNPHPVCAADGWWRRPIRLSHPPVARPAPIRDRRDRSVRSAAKLLLVGGGTQHPVIGRCAHRGIAFDHVEAGEMDSLLRARRPWAVLDTAGGDPTLSRTCEDLGIFLARLDADDGTADRLLDRLIDRSCPPALGSGERRL